MLQKKLLFLIVLLIIVMPTVSQSNDVCSGLMTDVVANIPASCDETGRNEICFGNPSILAEPQPDVIDFQFSAVGDIEEIIKLKTLRLSAIDTAGPEWGVTLMRLQANLPDTLPGENVTFIMFGDTQLVLAEPPVEIPATITANQAVNVRANDNTASSVVGTVNQGDMVTATGINTSGEWVRVTLPDDTQGWIASFLLSVDGDENLTVVSAEDAVYAPLQAMYFSSGIGESRCQDVPDKGLLIQTPKGAGTINFLINEVSIKVGSTLFVQATPDDYLTIYVLEGEIEVSAFDVTKTVPEGAYVRVPINADLQATGAPEDVRAYDADSGLDALPIQLLPEAITIAEPLSEDDLAELDSCTGVNDAVINARQGPGTVYGNRQLSAGTTSTIDGQAQGTDGFIWYRIGTDGVWWVRLDLVTLSGDCSDLPTITDIPEAPTPAPVTANTSSSSSQNNTAVNASPATTIDIWTCESRNLIAGMVVRWQNCVRAGFSFAEASANLSGHSAGISVDGVNLSPITYSAVFQHVASEADSWGWCAWGNWVAESGTHTTVGTNTYNGATSVCTVTIP